MFGALFAAITAFVDDVMAPISAVLEPLPPAPRDSSIILMRRIESPGAAVMVFVRAICSAEQGGGH